MNAIASFRFSEPHETFSPSTTSSQSPYSPIPPAVFSRIQIPQAYNFKQNPFSIPTTTTNPETGEEKTRLINKDRYKGAGMTLLAFGSKNPIPEGPTEGGKNLLEADIRVVECVMKVRWAGHAISLLLM